jgi:hypothetical protein
MPWFLPHIKNRDIGINGYYDGDIPRSEAVNTAISARRKGKTGIDALPVFDELLNQAEEDLYREGLSAIEERDPLVAEALRQYNGAVLDVAGYVVPYYQLANPKAHKHYSVIGSVAARRHKEAPFVAIVCDNPLAISLRASSQSTVNVGEVAQSLGGGGQPRSAGYTIKSQYEIDL